MITIDLRNTKVLNFERKPLIEDMPDASLAFALSRFVLTTAKSGSATKMVLWCWRIADDEPLVLDEGDFKLLQDVVKAAEITDILKGQLEMAITEAKAQSDRDQKEIEEKKRAEAEAEKKALEEYRRKQTEKPTISGDADTTWDSKAQ